MTFDDAFKALLLTCKAREIRLRQRIGTVLNHPLIKRASELDWPTIF